MYSSKCPPIFGDNDNFPSLKAPAPPQPDTTEQLSQLKHPWPGFFFIGHSLLEISLPFSSIKISKLASFFKSSKAVNIPVGPVPTIITSYLFLLINKTLPFLFPFYCCRGFRGYIIN